MGATRNLAIRLFDDAEVLAHEDRRFVDNRSIITSAGIAAGIDMSLHVVERLLGQEVAAATAKHLEYPWKQT